MPGRGRAIAGAGRLHLPGPVWVWVLVLDPRGRRHHRHRPPARAARSATVPPLPQGGGTAPVTADGPALGSAVGGRHGEPPRPRSRRTTTIAGGIPKPPAGKFVVQVKTKPDRSTNVRIRSDGTIDYDQTMPGGQKQTTLRDEPGDRRARRTPRRSLSITRNGQTVDIPPADGDRRRDRPDHQDPSARTARRAADGPPGPHRARPRGRTSDGQGQQLRHRVRGGHAGGRQRGAAGVARGRPALRPQGHEVADHARQARRDDHDRGARRLRAARGERRAREQARSARKIDLKAITVAEKPEAAAGSTVRLVGTIVAGHPHGDRPRRSTRPSATRSSRSRSRSRATSSASPAPSATSCRRSSPS